MKSSTQLKALIRNLVNEKKINAQILMRNYMLERLLERISLSKYRLNFILKGGEYEQAGSKNAEYGKQLLKLLSKELTKELGKGFSVSNLQYMRRFYLEYPKQQTLSVKLSWSHYCEILNVSDKNARSFYVQEAVNSNWSVRELRRQVNTSLFEA